jgi:hypothetical protein
MDICLEVFVVTELNKGLLGVQPHQGIYKIQHFADNFRLHHQENDGDGFHL